MKVFASIWRYSACLPTFSDVTCALRCLRLGHSPKSIVFRRIRKVPYHFGMYQVGTKYQLSLLRVGSVADGGTIFKFQNLYYGCTKPDCSQPQILHLLCLLIPTENTFLWLAASTVLDTTFFFDIASFPKYQSNARETSHVCFAKQIGFGYPHKFSGSFDQILHPVANLEFMPNLASSSEINLNSFMWATVGFVILICDRPAVYIVIKAVQIIYSSNSLKTLLLLFNSINLTCILRKLSCQYSLQVLLFIS